MNSMRTRLSVLASLTGLPHLATTSLGLVLQHLGSSLLCLLLVDELHENTLVPEHVALGLQVQFVIQVAIDLLSLPVSLEESPNNTHSPNPQGFLRHPGILGSFPLSEPGMTTFSSSLVILAHARPGVDSHRFLDDQTILDELPDVLARIGIGDLVDLIGVEPNLIFT